MTFCDRKHFRDVHGLPPDNLIKNFKVIKKCRGQFERLNYKMLWIKNKLNTQADSTLYLSECFHANLFFHYQYL